MGRVQNELGENSVLAWVEIGREDLSLLPGDGSREDLGELAQDLHVLESPKSHSLVLGIVPLVVAALISDVSAVPLGVTHLELELDV
jgi:hypothetical protein